jgi:hypothetical protein
MARLHGRWFRIKYGGNAYQGNLCGRQGWVNRQNPTAGYFLIAKSALVLAEKRFAPVAFSGLGLYNQEIVDAARLIL